MSARISSFAAGPLRIELFHAVLTFKSLYSPGGIDQTLLPGVERVAIGTYLDVDLRQSGTGFESVTAGAGDDAAPVPGMNISFHLSISAYLIRIQK